MMHDCIDLVHVEAVATTRACADRFRAAARNSGARASAYPLRNHPGEFICNATFRTGRPLVRGQAAGDLRERLDIRYDDPSGRYRHFPKLEPIRVSPVDRVSETPGSMMRP